MPHSQGKGRCQMPGGGGRDVEVTNWLVYNHMLRQEATGQQLERATPWRFLRMRKNYMKQKNSCTATPTHHMSICVEYSVEPKSTSGGLYLKKDNSLNFLFLNSLHHKNWHTRLWCESSRCKANSPLMTSHSLIQKLKKIKCQLPKYRPQWLS